MSHCAVYGCNSNSNSRHLITVLESPIVIDDYGSVLDEMDTKFYSLPSIPQQKGKIIPSEEAVRQATECRQRWIFLLFRADKLPKNQKDIYICSRHFGREAYDSFAPMRHGKISFLELARSNPKVRLLLPNALPSLNLPKRVAEDTMPTARAKRQKTKDQTEIVKSALVQR